MTTKDTGQVWYSDQPDGWEELGPILGPLANFGFNLPDRRGMGTVGMGIAILCAWVKARDLAKADMLLWKRDGRGWVEEDRHWFAQLLGYRPNEWQTWTEFWRMVVMHLELSQNAYVVLERNRVGDVVGMIPMMPGRTQMLVSASGRVFYQFDAGSDVERATLMGGRYYFVVPAERVIHFRGRSLDGISGLSNSAIGGPFFQIADNIASYQIGVFGNDGVQPLVFETDVTFPGDQGNEAFKRLKSQLGERLRKSRNSGDPILLEAGLKAKEIALDAKESMSIEAFDQTVSKICTLMDCPPQKIYHLIGVKYDNQAHLNNVYAYDILEPLAKNIEERLRLSILPREEALTFYPEFDREMLRAGDIEGKIKMIEMGVKNSLLTLNEARDRAFQAQPRPGMDRVLVPVNMALMDPDTGEIEQQAADGQNGNDGEEGTPNPSPGEERSLRIVK